MKRALSLAAPHIAVLVPLLLCLPFTVTAQDQTSLVSSLDSLLNLPVKTASKFAQMSREASASVTVITSEEIRRQGFRTVAEVLETVPGFYTTSNRSYQSLGVRGFSPLSGDNNRVLILLDGHSLNENFLDGARIGTGLGIDLSVIDRVEVVRGPSSALYGGNAMLAVVNLITKTGRSIDGIEVATELGSTRHRKGSFLLGREFRSGLGVTLSGMWSKSDGAELYFPEWDTPLTNGGVSVGADWDEGKGLLGAAAFRSWKLVGFFSERAKGTPTAPFGSNFGDPNAQSTDRRFFGELSFERDLASDKSLALRAYYDGADFDITYPFALTGDVRGQTSGRWLGVESHFRWDPTPAHRITLGAELRDNRRARTGGADPVLGLVEGDFPSTVASAFGQAALQLRERLQLTVGGRVDHYSTVGAALSPRGGLVFNAASGTTLKALYGEAFRAPNQPELNVDAPPFIRRNPDIQPERIRTFELVWEQRLNSSVYATVAGYDYAMTRLITVLSDPLDGALYFANSGSGSARGLELSVDAHPLPGISLRGGYGYQSPHRADDRRVANSPRHSFRAAVGSTLLPWAELGLRAMYDSGRAGRPGKSATESYLLTNATVTNTTFDHLRLSLVGENLFDVGYWHPAGPEFLQDAHPQIGRTFRLRIDVVF